MMTWTKGQKEKAMAIRTRDIKKLRNIDRDDVLKWMGLEERTPVGDFFTGLSLFAVGCLVGAGVGLLFAPKRGAEMREQVGGALRRGQRMAQDYARDNMGTMGSTAGGAETSTINPRM
jgi:hypothetical protein